MEAVWWAFYRHFPARDGDHARVCEYVEELVLSVPGPDGVAVHPQVHRVCLLVGLVFSRAMCG